MCCPCAGHAPETPGVWSHSFDNSAVTWFPPKMSCGCDAAPCYNGGDALVMSISTRAKNEGKVNGAWCDVTKTYKGFYICEGVI